MLFKKSVLVAGLGLLVGCASKPAPQMDAQGYASFAKAWVGLSRCIASGKVDPEIGALGVRYFQSELGRFTYQPQQLDAEVAKLNATNPVVPDAVCNQAAVAIAGKKQQIDINNASVQRNEQALQAIIDNRPTQVYCNTVSGTTMCNGM